MVRIYFRPEGHAGRSHLVGKGYDLKEACNDWLFNDVEYWGMLFSDYERETGDKIGIDATDDEADEQNERFSDWVDAMSGAELFDYLRDGRAHWYVDDVNEGEEEEEEEEE